MSRTLMYILVLPLLGAETWAQFIAHDQQLVSLFAILGLGVVAVRYVLGPQEDDETCPPDCQKCIESESMGEDL